MTIPTGPYFGGYTPNFPAPVPGTVGPGPVFDGQYAWNTVSDPTVNYALGGTNAMQNSYYAGSMNAPVSGDSNLNWYNSCIAPVMQQAEATMASVNGGATTGAAYPSTNVPGMQQGYPQGYPPMGAEGEGAEGQAPEAGKSSGNSMLTDVGGFAAVGAGIGFFCGGGPVTAAIGGGIGAVVGGLKHMFFG